VRNPAITFRAGQFEETESDVPFHRKPRKDAALLKNKDAAGIRTTHSLAINAYRSASWRKKTRHDT
jgi:hypothetical protein